jgi:hypothetical protein
MKVQQMRLMLSVLAVLVFLSAVAFAQTIVGGYDLEKLATSTAQQLANAGVVKPSDKFEIAAVKPSAANDPLVRGADIVAFYDRLGVLLVKKKIASQQEIDAVKKSVSESGGMKTGGLNPVVLAASYLDLLARKGIITLHEAQSILDSAKIS